MRLPRFALPLLVVASLAGGLIAGASFAPPRAPTVGVVDLEQVFNTIDSHAARDATLKKLADELDGKLKELEQVVKDLQLELQNFQAGSQAALDLQTRVQKAIGDYKAYEQFARLKVESEKAKAMRESYLEIKDACKALAQDRGLDLVMLDDSIPELEKGNASRTVQQISARRFLYTNGEFNVSADLIARMNDDFKAKGGVAPPRPAPTSGSSTPPANAVGAGSKP